MLSFLDRFPTCSAAVIGDLMLDCYLYGEVTRISPEAPVPVVRSESEKSVPGGAANVATNLATLGLHVRVVGLTGKDEAREQLIDRMHAHGRIDIAGMISAPHRRTTKKLRILGAHQQIIRIDHEDIANVDALTESQLVQAALSAIEASDVVVLSDYGKGVLSDRVLSAAIERARALGKEILVDPKRRDFSAYRGASLLTPNRKELTDATQLACETDDEASKAVVRAQMACGADILLTRSEKGMSFFPLGGVPHHVATVAQDVFDVSGAGDTVVAVLAASIAAGMPIIDGMKMANHAAGIVVAKLGTACVTREELYASLVAETVSPSVNDGRCVDLEGAIALRWAWAREKLTVGVANGCFDLLHPGHISLIRQAAEGCDRLIMALNSDASVRKLKGPTRPVQDEQARATVVGAIKGVSAVVLFSEETPLELIQALQPDVLIKGADYTEDKVVGADIVKARGGRVILADLSPGHSTTKLIRVANINTGKGALPRVAAFVK
jgi:D-beta-D-heptose 7-phosphate kinase/D-beta-D-heptose 1-phosphate adenosyltransferase